MLLQESFFVVFHSCLPRNGTRKNPATGNDVKIWYCCVPIWCCDVAIGAALWLEVLTLHVWAEALSFWTWLGSDDDAFFTFLTFLERLKFWNDQTFLWQGFGSLFDSALERVLFGQQVVAQRSRCATRGLSYNYNFNHLESKTFRLVCVRATRNWSRRLRNFVGFWPDCILFWLAFLAADFILTPLGLCLGLFLGLVVLTDLG